MRWKHVFFLGLSALLVMPVSANNLFVFVPTNVRAKAMQQNISTICPGITVTVFARSKDFRKQVKKSPPDAILSLLPVINRNNPFETVMRGMQKGDSEEEYILVSVDEPLEMSKVNKKKIGVVDLLGRKPMGEFISRLFQADVKIKRVTKPEDLLPLLTFGSVDGIFISERDYINLKKSSKLNLVYTRLNIKVGLVSAALAETGTKQNIVECLNRFDSELNTTLGVDQWHLL